MENRELAYGEIEAVYKNRDTGELFTESEMLELWNQYGFESKYESFDEFVYDHEIIVEALD